MSTISRNSQIRGVICKETAEELLAEIINHCAESSADDVKNGFIELRAFPEGTAKKLPAKQHWIPIASANQKEMEEALNWCEQRSLEGCGVFVGYNPRKEYGGSKKEHVAGNVACYADLDIYKTDKNTEELAEELKKLMPVNQPTIYVKSGGGLQLIWLFSEPLPQEEWERLQRALKAAFTAYGADEAVVTDNSRVLRLPGFPNLKQETPRLAKLEGEVRAEPANPALLLSALMKRLGKGEDHDNLTAKVAGGFRLPAEIPEGGTVEQEGRNRLLFKEASALRDRGYSELEIETSLLVLNDGRCKPPMGEEEVRTIARSACRYTPSVDVTEGCESISDFSLGALVKADLAPADYIIHGLPRGHIGQIVAITNVGKTKFLRNLSLSLACGREYLNIAKTKESRKVLYLDFEDDAANAVRDLTVMRKELDSYEQSLVDKNLFYVVDKEIHGEGLSLANPAHLAWLERVMAEIEPDLFVVDTMIAAFGGGISSENDNNEVVNKICQPLKRLARRFNCAVLIAHHRGKAGENGVNDRSNIHAGRGASSLAGFARSIYNLDIVTENGSKFVKFSAPKIKGRHLDDMILTFDTTGTNRWFEEDGAYIPAADDPYTVFLQSTKDAISASGGEVSRAEALKLSGLSKASFDRYVERAEREKQIAREKRGSSVFLRLA